MFNKYKNALKYKQPQEAYCSTSGCFERVADHHHMRHLLDDKAEELSKHFCFDCVLERMINC